MNTSLETPSHTIPKIFTFASASLGLSFVALANAIGREGIISAQPLYWMGLLLFIIPITMMLLDKEIKENERIILLLLVALGFYFFKIYHSPSNFTFHDELVHWRTASDILSTKALFHENTIIPTSALYPGLGMITSALVDLSGISIFQAGIIILGIAKCLGVLSLYFFYKLLFPSEYLASLAALIYCSNPSFIYFDSQFSYKSLSIPLLCFNLFLIFQAINSRSVNRRFLFLSILICSSALVATHHLTSYFLLFILSGLIFSPFLQKVLIKIVNLFLCIGITRRFLKIIHLNNSRIFYKRKRNIDTKAIPLFLFVFVLCIVWLIFIASFTLKYLSPYLFGAIIEILKIINGEATGRVLFRSYSGQVTPLFEQLLGYLATLLAIVTLFLGFIIATNRRRSEYIYLVALISLLYPASLIFRFTIWGTEASNRLSAYLYIPTAFMIAITLFYFINLKPHTSVKAVSCSIAIVILFMGNLIVGWPLWARLPGPYLVSADMRSVEIQGISAAIWTKDHLGENNWVSTDRINSLLMNSYGNQRVVTAIHDGILMAPVFFNTQLGRDELNLIEQSHVNLLVVDYRLANALPMAEVYFERGEPNSYHHRQAIPIESLRKFDQSGYSRIYDNGSIAIFMVKEGSND